MCPTVLADALGLTGRCSSRHRVARPRLPGPCSGNDLEVTTGQRTCSSFARLGPLPRLAAFVAALALLGACTSDSPASGQSSDQAPTTSSTSGPAPSVGGVAPDEVAGAGVFGRIPDIVREVEPSIVAVLTDIGEGSGVVWGSDGTIVTNDHVTAGTSRIEVGFADGRRVVAELVASDPLTDLAVLRADRDDLPAGRFAEQLPEVGELAVAMGNPLGFENTVTAGIVSGLHRAIPGSSATTQSLVDLIQTDAAISPGNSGGALVDADGEVIGINVAYIPPQARAVSLGFAIPSATVLEVVPQLLEDGSVSHAFFGAVPASLTPQIAERLGVGAEAGVLMLEVIPDGPAAAAGVMGGDAVTTIDGDSVETVEDFLAALRNRDPGEQITVGLVRGDETVEVTVTLADRPPAAG